MVVTVIAATSLRGYWRTLIVFIACKPAMRMIKLTTIARTGRRIKRSVNDFMSILRVHWSWTHLRFGREIVVDRHQHSVAQLENASTNHHLIWFQTLDDRHEIAPGFAHPDNLRSNCLRFFAALRILFLFDHINRVAVGRVRDRRPWNDERLVLFRQHDFHLREHSWPQFVVG